MPAFLFLHAGQLTDSLIGATAPDLVGKVRENAITASIHNEEPSSAASTAAEPAPVPLDTRLAARSVHRVMRTNVACDSAVVARGPAAITTRVSLTSLPAEPSTDDGTLNL